MAILNVSQLVRIRHGELEGLRADPRAWAAQRTGPPRWIPHSYGQTIRLAIHRFHAMGDASVSRSHLAAMMDRFSLRNSTRRQEAEQQLDRYLSWVSQEQPIILARKLRLELPIGRRVLICGEIPRVDLDRNTGSYRAVLLGTIGTGWQDELRMPLLQRAAARKMQRNEEEFTIGVQELDGSGLSVVHFDAVAMDAAEALAVRLIARGLRAISRMRAQGVASP